MRVLAAILVSLIFSGCLKDGITANGNTVEEIRNVGDFTGISSSGSTKVHVTYGAEYQVKLKGSSNLTEIFKTSVSGNTLNIGYKNINVHDPDVEVFITAPIIGKIRLSGSGNVYFKGDFPLRDSFDADISGSADIYLTGSMKFNSFDANISGSGKMNLLNLEVKKADISISGSGDVRVTVTEKLKVRISGSGDVYYVGNPNVNSSVSGSGKVNKL